MFKNIDIKKIVGLIFDVDELLFDNNKDIRFAYEEILKTRFIVPEIGEMYLGKNLFEIVSKIKSKYKLRESLDELVQERRIMYLEKLKTSTSKPCCGVKEIFKFIEKNKRYLNIRIAYATSSEKVFTEIILKKIFTEISMPQYAANPDSFFFNSDGECASTCWRQGLTKKPNPEIHNRTVTKMKLEPQQCIAFEDSLSGFQAAYAAGLNVIIIPNKNNKNKFLQHDYETVYEDRICKLNSLKDFLPFLKSLRQNKEITFG